MRWWWWALLLAACSKPQVLATIDGDVSSITVDDTYLYATVMALGKPRVVRVPKVGGDAETIIAKTEVARGLTAVGGKLFWCELAIEDRAPGVTVISADEIRRHGGISAAVSNGVRHFGRIMMASSRGGASTELARFDGVPNQLMVDDESIYVLSLGVWPVGGDLDVTQGSLVKIPRSGGAITVLADHLQKPRDFTLDSTSAYWASTDGTWKISKAGGKPEQTTAPAATYIDGSFELTLLAGKTRYHVVNHDSRATLTAESR